MTCDPYTVSEDTPLDKVVRIMERKNVKRVPVLREAKLVGIITRANLLHAIAYLAEKSQPVAGGDAATRDRILSELGKLPWRATVSVNVHDGVVNLSGTILSEGEREAFEVYLGRHA
jgi:predicted transcriptional regulator